MVSNLDELGPIASRELVDGLLLGGDLDPRASGLVQVEARKFRDSNLLFDVTILVVDAILDVAVSTLAEQEVVLHGSLLRAVHVLAAAPALASAALLGARRPLTVVNALGACHLLVLDGVRALLAVVLGRAKDGALAGQGVCVAHGGLEAGPLADNAVNGAELSVAIAHFKKLRADGTAVEVGGGDLALTVLLGGEGTDAVVLARSAAARPGGPVADGAVKRARTGVALGLLLEGRARLAGVVALSGDDAGALLGAVAAVAEALLCLGVALGERSPGRHTAVDRAMVTVAVLNRPEDRARLATVGNWVRILRALHWVGLTPEAPRHE